MYYVESLNDVPVLAGLHESYTGRSGEGCAIFMSERIWKPGAGYKWKGRPIEVNERCISHNYMLIQKKIHKNWTYLFV